jgi:hypothetical protein
MEDYYLERLRMIEARADDSPRELQELSARMSRLMERLWCGDPDMTADELQAAIDRAEMKWRELQSQGAPGRALSKLFATLLRGAELYRRRVVLGLSGDPNAASKRASFCANGWLCRAIDRTPGAFRNEAARLRNDRMELVTGRICATCRV